MYKIHPHPIITHLLDDAMHELISDVATSTITCFFPGFFPEHTQVTPGLPMLQFNKYT